jgi:protein TonB
VIIKDNLPDKAPVIAYIIPSNAELDTETVPVEETGINAYVNSGKTKEPVKIPAPLIDKNIPVNSPEVLPQFPGGINELINFLKRNLHSPKYLEDGEEITVKVRFVVNFDGNLVNFAVVETGGEPFDNEVIRVLKKMPKWIFGKSNGENISAYFIVPVKFTAFN